MDRALICLDDFWEILEVGMFRIFFGSEKFVWLLAVRYCEKGSKRAARMEVSMWTTIVKHKDSMVMLPMMSMIDP